MCPLLGNRMQFGQAVSGKRGTALPDEWLPDDIATPPPEAGPPADSDQQAETPTKTRTRRSRKRGQTFKFKSTTIEGQLRELALAIPADRASTQTKELHWVAENMLLEIEDLHLPEIPSRAALAMWSEAKTPGGPAKFWAQYLKPATGAKQARKRLIHDDEGGEQADSVLDEIESLARELGAAE